MLTIVTPLYLLTDIVITRWSRLPEAPLSAWLFMIISGFIGAGIAHSWYYYSVPVLGVGIVCRPRFVAALYRRTAFILDLWRKPDIVADHWRTAAALRLISRHQDQISIRVITVQKPA
ncbi:MAG: hypothetical protein GY801_36930 [bacterium]|nr:hypothetical protein [bacterium]